MFSGAAASWLCLFYQYMWMAFRSVSFFLLLFRLFSVPETFSVFTLDYTHNIARSVQISPARVRKEVGHYIHLPSHLDPALSLGSIISSWNGPLARKCRSSSGAKGLGYWLHKEMGGGEEMREPHLFSWLNLDIAIDTWHVQVLHPIGEI